MKRWHIGGAVVALLAASVSSPAIASGGPGPSPTYIRVDGGLPADRARFLAGRTGIVLPGASEEMLFAQWRLLHRLPLGPGGEDLITPAPWTSEEEDDGTAGWLAARALVKGVPASPSYMAVDRLDPGSFQYVPTCSPDALNLATVTLKDRVQRYGGDNPAVKAWLLTQDQVFAHCNSVRDQPLPALPADAPAWLRYDRAYQEAAWFFYNSHYHEAAARFGAIARDAGSPWRQMGRYLVARSTYWEMLEEATPGNIDAARTAVDALAAAPAGSYGKSQIVPLRRAIDYRARPDWLFVDLDRALRAPEPPVDLVYAFRDYQWLGEDKVNRPKPDIADWLATIRNGRGYQSEGNASVAAHARERWGVTKDVAWLVAALVLADPGDAGIHALVADASKVAPGDPAWLTAQYHLMRLTIGTAPAAETRARVEHILAIPSITLSERNLFTGIRAQVATSLTDFVRYALRKPFCVSASPAACVGEPGDYDALYGDVTLARGAQGWVGLGEESRAIIDRMPLAMRIALSRTPSLPRAMRMDVALTNFPRAVLMQDNKAIDAVARDLVTLLPQMAADWRGVLAARPGEAKRFATSFAMAKIPGLTTDLSDYYRPQGTIRQFQGYWREWTLVPKGAAIEPAFPKPDGYRSDTPWNYANPDLTCRGKCGTGDFALHLPGFVAAQAEQGASERRAFSFPTDIYQSYAYEEGKSPRPPKGSIAVWDALYDYARAHPRDPRSPEALYWLNRITRWGPNPDGRSKRAFQLLHARYPGSSWAKRAPYYWD